MVERKQEATNSIRRRNSVSELETTKTNDETEDTMKKKIDSEAKRDLPEQLKQKNKQKGKNTENFIEQKLQSIVLAVACSIFVIRPETSTVWKAD